MDDDKQDTAPGASPKRPPPTIELTAAEVSDGAPKDGAQAKPDAAPGKSWRERLDAARFSIPWPPFPARPSASRLAPMIVAAAAGALAALLVLGASWLASDSGVSSRIVSRLPQSTAKSDMEKLNTRIAKIESRASESSTASVSPADQALASRLDALEKSVAALRDDLVSAKTAIDAIKAAPQDDSKTPDLAAIEDRISKIERATVALTGIATPQKAIADDPQVQRVAAATALDAAVNKGAPYEAALAAAKSQAGDDALKPLDPFAAKGVPPATALTRELLALLPQLLPKQPASAPPSGLLDRLKDSASKLVRIQRIDNDANETAAIVARAKSAAQRDDLASARREVESLSGWDRAPVASWIEKVDAREAALAASRQFVADTMAALPKPAR